MLKQAVQKLAFLHFVTAYTKMVFLFLLTPVNPLLMRVSESIYNLKVVNGIFRLYFH